MTNMVDVAVVGAGVMGSATAYWLALEGLNVLLLERFQIGHKRGSSHGPTRIFRFSYPDAFYVAMAQEALPLWRSVERESDTDLLITTGGLDVGPEIETNAKALAQCGADHELLDGDEARRRWPFLRLPGDGPVLFQPDGGVVMADRSVETFARLARSHGATIRSDARVRSLRPEEDGVELDVEGEAVRARCAVVTAGAWARRLLAAAGIELNLRPTRETVAYFRVAGPPLPLVEWGSPSVYALPSSRGVLKAAEHFAGASADPDEQGVPNYQSVERVAAWVSERYSGADPAPLMVETCLYTNTPDESFVIERHGPIVVGSACSGHGFKFAPLIGRRLASLAGGNP